jgi:hypothetical protein
MFERNTSGTYPHSTCLRPQVLLAKVNEDGNPFYPRDMIGHKGSCVYGPPVPPVIGKDVNPVRPTMGWGRSGLRHGRHAVLGSLMPMKTELIGQSFILFTI